MTRLRRLNLVVPASTAQRLERLKEQTSASSITEVIKAALLVYATVVDQLEDGRQFYTKRDGDDALVRTVFLIDVTEKTIVKGN